MDITPNSTNTLDTDTESETPPPPTQPTSTSKSKSLSFTNGSLKRHHPTTTTTAPPPPQPPSMVVSYKECLKNHAASLGGHALDGCGEFMPSSSSNPTEPRSLTCAACGCHRNFHRRDTQEYSNSNPNFLSCYYSPPPSAAAPPPPPPLPHRGLSLSTSQSLNSSPGPSPLSSPSPPPLSHHFPPPYHHSSAPPHMLLALGNAYSDEQHGIFNNSSVGKTEYPNGKKRYRTRFSQEQKEKMISFSEKLGWRMHKGDEGLVQEFCNEIGVSRGVFKVWMHNNKNTLRKRSSEKGNAITDEKINGDHNGNGEGGRDGFDSDINNSYNANSSNNGIHRNEGSCVNLHVSVNGSSSN